LGCSWDYRIWIQRSANADPLFRFVRKGKAGYIDSTGKVVIEPKFDGSFNSQGEFHDGLLEIAVSDGRYVDRTGNVVLDKGFYRGWDFSEGLAAAMPKEGGLWGYINTSGEFAISPRFRSSQEDYVWPFSDGFAQIKVAGRYGYIDHTGNFVIPPKFLEASDFHDGMARVVLDGPCVYFADGPCRGPVFVGGRQTGPPCKFTFINKSGQVLGTTPFDAARNFSEGLAPVKVGAFWGFIDKTGSFMIPPKFEDAEPFSSGLCRIQAQGRYGYSDHSGNIQISPQYEYAEDFREGLAVVGSPLGRYWYIDTHGNRTIPGEYAAASQFFHGLAHVRFLGKRGNHDKFAYIDSSGKRVFSYSD
jgi:hypothetical protein